MLFTKYTRKLRNKTRISTVKPFRIITTYIKCYFPKLCQLGDYLLPIDSKCKLTNVCRKKWESWSQWEVTLGGFSWTHYVTETTTLKMLKIGRFLSKRMILWRILVKILIFWIWVLLWTILFNYLNLESLPVKYLGFIFYNFLKYWLVYEKNIWFPSRILIFEKNPFAQ